MFGIFKSNYDRAVEATCDFIADMALPIGELRGSVLRDPYCLGFLQIVGMHVAAKSLKGRLNPEEPERAFEDALKTIAPSLAAEAAELLSLIRSENSPNNAAYLRGKKDGDTFMAYKLLHFLSESSGEPALEQFYDRVRQVMSQQQDPPSQSPLQKSEQTEVGKWLVRKARASERLSPIHELGRTYNFSGLYPHDMTVTLTIVCTIETTRSVVGSETDSWRFIHGLSFHLQPFRLPQETPLVMQLFTVDELQGGKFDVFPYSIEGNSNTAVIAEFGDGENLEKCLSAIMSGTDMRFVLVHGKSLVNFLLPNDEEFMPLYDEACDQLTQFQIDTDIMRARDQGPPEAVSFVGDDERSATETTPFVSEREQGNTEVFTQRSLDRKAVSRQMKIVKKRTVTENDRGYRVEQTAWQAIANELVQCEFEVEYPAQSNLGPQFGALGIFLGKKIERIRFLLTPRNITERDTPVPQAVHFLTFKGRFLGDENSGFTNNLIVKPTFDLEDGWRFEFAEATSRFGSGSAPHKFDAQMSPEQVVANCVCSESFEVSIVRCTGSFDVSIGGRNIPVGTSANFAQVTLQDTEGLRLSISDIAGEEYLNRLLRMKGYVIDRSG
jgi:hypothetical protein